MYIIFKFQLYECHSRKLSIIWTKLNILTFEIYLKIRILCKTSTCKMQCSICLSVWVWMDKCWFSGDRLCCWTWRHWLRYRPIQPDSRVRLQELPVPVKQRPRTRRSPTVRSMSTSPSSCHACWRCSERKDNSWSQTKGVILLSGAW